MARWAPKPAWQTVLPEIRRLLVAAAITGVVIVSFILLAQRAQQAELARNDVAVRSTNRINGLLAKIDVLQSQITSLQNGAAVDNAKASAERADLSREVSVLIEQVRAAGGSPVTGQAAPVVVVTPQTFAPAVPPTDPAHPGKTPETIPHRPTTTTAPCPTPTVGGMCP